MGLVELIRVAAAALLLAGCLADFDHDFSTGDGGVGPDGAAGVCGNGLMETGEACDDGNQSAGDGCSSSCVVESGWTCLGEPSSCVEGCSGEGSACAFGASCCSGLCVEALCESDCSGAVGQACSDDGIRDYLTDGVCIADGSCYSQIIVTHPSASGITVDTGAEISWTNDAVPNGDTVLYTVEYSDDSGATWNTMVTDWGFQDQNSDGQATWEESSSGTESHLFHIALPRVANVIEAKVSLRGVPASSTTSSQVVGYCKDGFSDPNLITDAQAFDSDFIMGLNCDAPHDTELGFVGSPGYMTFRYQGVNINGGDVDVDVTTYRQQTNGVDNWGVYVSSDNASWALCGALIPGQDGYNSFTRTCTSFTGTDLYIKVNVESAGSNAANGVSFVEVTYPADAVSPSNVSLDVAASGTAEFQHTGEFTTTSTTSDFAAELNAYLTGASENPWENVAIPFELTFTDGRVEISSIHIEYTDYYWQTDTVAAGSTYRVRVTQTAGTGSGASDVSDYDFEIVH